MSAPRTNIKKQEKRHFTPLLVMALVAIFGVGLIVYWTFEEVDQSPQTQDRGTEQQEAAPPAAPQEGATPAPDAAPAEEAEPQALPPPDSNPTGGN